jgi:hypothetical protein
LSRASSIIHEINSDGIMHFEFSTATKANHVDTKIPGLMRGLDLIVEKDLEVKVLTSNNTSTELRIRVKLKGMCKVACAIHVVWKMIITKVMAQSRRS